VSKLKNKSESPGRVPKMHIPTGSVDERAEEVMQFLNECIDDDSLTTTEALDFTKQLVSDLQDRIEGLKSDLGEDE